MTDDGKPFHNPFGALAGLRNRLPEPEKPSEPQPAPARTAPGVKSVPRAVVRMQRSGRGGKQVTVVEHLSLSPADREKWLRDLKAALGCGGVLEGDALVLQGDQRKRLPMLLEARGVKKITMG